MTEQEAREMIAEICKWLEEGAPGAVIDRPYQSVAVDLARDFCDELLSSSGADGLGGCRLCQG